MASSRLYSATEQAPTALQNQNTVSKNVTSANIVKESSASLIISKFTRGPIPTRDHFLAIFAAKSFEEEITCVITGNGNVG